VSPPLSFRAPWPAPLAEWASPSNVQLSSQFLGFTNLDPDVDDGFTVIGFRSRPDLDRTLGATSFEIDAVTGQFIAADIFLNSFFEWSAAANGDSTRFDVASVVTHESRTPAGPGSFGARRNRAASGGGRLVLGKRAVMFPIAYPRGSVLDRSLRLMTSPASRTSMAMPTRSANSERFPGASL
jgi:hypothetical protein